MPRHETGVLVRPATQTTWRFSGASWQSRPMNPTSARQKRCCLSPLTSPDGGGLRILGSLPKKTACRSAPHGHANTLSMINRHSMSISVRPEITIGVNSHVRGQGVGGTLLDALIAEAGRRGVGLCLTVRHDNPARRLYERVGFCLVPGSAVPNRVGGTSFGMIWAAPWNGGCAPPTRGV
jgi:hypothetical protein